MELMDQYNPTVQALRKKVKGLTADNRKLRRASPASVPEGQVLVPVEPTEEMKLAWVSHKSFDGCYKAMLAAAPPPPVSEDRKDAERYRDGWTHSCNALCMEIALWIERCPHCGRPAPKAPATQEDKP